jgi:hypothetical protein
MGPIAHTRGWSRSPRMGPIYSGVPRGVTWSTRFSVRATCLRALTRLFRDALQPGLSYRATPRRRG